MIEPFPALIAFTPLIIYLFAFATLRIAGLAWVSTGARDLAAVLMAVSGFIVIGPMELFFPNATASYLGAIVWAPLILLYLLLACLLILSSKPKLIIYGRTMDDVYPALVRAAREMDAGTIENGEQMQVHLPNLKAHFRIEAAPGHDCLSVIAFEPLLPPGVWSSLRKQLRTHLKTTAAPRPRHGWLMLSVASALTYYLARYLFAEPARVVEGFREWVIR